MHPETKAQIETKTGADTQPAEYTSTGVHTRTQTKTNKCPEVLLWTDVRHAHIWASSSASLPGDLVIWCSGSRENSEKSSA